MFEKKKKKDFIDIEDEPQINLPSESQIKDLEILINELTKNDAGPITGQTKKSK